MIKILQTLCKRFMILIPANKTSMSSKIHHKSLGIIVASQSLIAISFAALLLPFSKNGLANLIGGFIVVLANSTLLFTQHLKPKLSSFIISSVTKYTTFALLLLLCHAYSSIQFHMLFPGMICTQLSFPFCCYFAERFSWQ